MLPSGLSHLEGSGATELVVLTSRDSKRPRRPSQGPRSRRKSPGFAATHSAQPSPVSPEKKDRALLIRVDGPETGQVFAIAGDGLTLGRQPDTDLRIDELGVSRRHARIRRVDAHYEIEDLGSHNGTYVSGKRVKSVTLAEGSLIQIGSQASFRFTRTTHEHEQLLRQLYEFSTRDALTGVYNRRHFDERLRSELAFATRHNTPLGLILLDVDRFKQINDVYGHLGGDNVLTEVARRLVHMLRGEDLVARYGGEEFAVLLRSSGIPGCVHAAERLRAAIEEAPCPAGDREVSITISGGCASLGECDAPTAVALISLADERLYAAKKGGRNRIVADG